MYSYLPKDIREIIEQRRRRERAWHVRLSICTSVISNIESTLLVYKNDIEKEEADLVRNYLQQAIALLAASDNAPKSPPIPHQTKPLKSKSVSQGKDIIKNKALNHSSTTLKSHKESQSRKSIPEDHFDVNKIQQNSWATVARNGHKKSRVQQSVLNLTNNIKPLQHHLPVRPSLIMRNSKNAKKSYAEKTDSRLFVRLPLEHEWRKLSPAGIREMIVKRLSISPASIGLIKSVRSGFALSPCSIEARENILKASGGLFLSGAKLEPATQWIPLLIPTVPKSKTLYKVIKKFQS
ncbi:putative eka-like protein [Erysiphe necator]|uniref:Putative eka-like protein n=1 Tax=Uncinula necator TaxID=52586 RepID=A0A0B1P429_UNCNE|nr:putative eka-like protein [Erysiphe necator]